MLFPDEAWLCIAHHALNRGSAISRIGARLTLATLCRQTNAIMPHVHTDWLGLVYRLWPVLYRAVTHTPDEARQLVQSFRWVATHKSNMNRFCTQHQLVVYTKRTGRVLRGPYEIEQLRDLPVRNKVLREQLDALLAQHDIALQMYNRLRVPGVPHLWF